MKYHRFKDIANSQTEEQYHTGVEKLKTDPVWKSSEKLRLWFENRWLAHKEV